MTDFNNMPELNIGLMIFSSLVTLFLLMGILYENKRSRPFMTGFIILLITNIMRLQAWTMVAVLMWKKGRMGRAISELIM